jgi:light-regulated signal transduction histidine kinase (bacteriophytochrome)
VLGHDITARVEAEQAVARLNHELERRVELRTAELAAANRELETFSYSVSHDLRAPLRHMTGFAAVLRERLGDTADAEALHCLDRITAAADRMSMLIDGLLQLSRTTRTPLATRDVDLQQLVAEVRRDCAAKAAADVVWDIGVLPAVSADRTLLRVVLTNLLENACKFTARRRPARIAVDAEAAHGWVRVHVRDNGVGFDPSYADKLFGMFQRLHPTHEFEGDGIGLATVRRIVERHGGEVGALGSVDGGATFWFTLPGVR